MVNIFRRIQFVRCDLAHSNSILPLNVGHIRQSFCEKKEKRIEIGLKLSEIGMHRL